MDHFHYIYFPEGRYFFFFFFFLKKAFERFVLQFVFFFVLVGEVRQGGKRKEDSLDMSVARVGERGSPGKEGRFSYVVKISY